MRTIGIILLSLIPFAVCLDIAFRLKRKRRTIGLLVYMFEEIRQAVRYARMPLNEILKEISCRGRYSELFDCRKETLYESLIETVKKNGAAESAESSDICLKGISRCDCASACEKLTVCIEELETQQADCDNEYKTKFPMFIKLGALGSAFAAIILI